MLNSEIAQVKVQTCYQLTVLKVLKVKLSYDVDDYCESCVMFKVLNLGKSNETVFRLYFGNSGSHRYSS